MAEKAAWLQAWIDEGYHEPPRLALSEQYEVDAFVLRERARVAQRRAENLRAAGY